MPALRTSPQRHRRGFILLFGSKRVMSNETGETVDARCPRCGAEGSLHGVHVRSWFTIFFIPLFPVSGVQRYTMCRKCDASFAMPAEQFAGAAARADARQTQRAISMYNSLRASPGNSITLNELMQLYASMSDFPQAISAANDFSQALNSSEQCMTTLGRMYLLQGDHASAIRWFDQAISRNPDQSEAQFLKATALMGKNPPDFEKAAPAARAARKGDYPGAEELLNEIEQKMRTAM